MCVNEAEAGGRVGCGGLEEVKVGKIEVPEVIHLK